MGYKLAFHSEIIDPNGGRFPSSQGMMIYTEMSGDTSTLIYHMHVALYLDQQCLFVYI